MRNVSVALRVLTLLLLTCGVSLAQERPMEVRPEKPVELDPTKSPIEDPTKPVDQKKLLDPTGDGRAEKERKKFDTYIEELSAKPFPMTDFVPSKSSKPGVVDWKAPDSVAALGGLRDDLKTLETVLREQLIKASVQPKYRPLDEREEGIRNDAILMCLQDPRVHDILRRHQSKTLDMLAALAPTALFFPSPLIRDVTQQYMRALYAHGRFEEAWAEGHLLNSSSARHIAFAAKAHAAGSDVIALFAECGDCDATSPGAISYEPLRDFQLMVASRFSKLEPKHRGLVASDRLMDLYLPDKSGQRFTIVRYDKRSGAVRAISGDEARTSLRAHCDRVVGAYTQPGFDLAAPIAVKKGYQIITASGEVNVTAAELATLRAGTALPADHPLSQLLAGSGIVIYTNPLATEGRWAAETNELAFALRRAYPEARVLKDELTKSTPQRAQQLANATISPEHLVVVAPAKSFKVDDRNIINNMRDDLAADGVPVVDFEPGMRWGRPAGEGVIVVSGHTNEQLAKYIRALGAAGAFRGNVVIVNSCEATRTYQLASEINSRYGAIASAVYEGKIKPTAVAALVRSVVKEAKEKGSVKLEESWLRNAHDQKLNPIWTICRRKERDRWLI